MQKLGLQKLGLNFSYTFGRQISASIIQTIIIIIIARVYGPTGNGIYTLALLLPTMLSTLLNLGIGPANVYYIGSSKVSVDAAWYSNLKLFTILSAIGISIGLYIIFYNADLLFQGVDKLILLISLAIFPVKLLTSIISSIFQGLQDFKSYNKVLIMQPLLTLILVAFIVLVGFNKIIYIIGAYLVSAIITLVISMYLLNLKNSIFTVDKGASKKNYEKELLNYGYKIHLTNILSFFNFRADIFIVNFFLGTSITGIYVISVQISEKLWLVSKAISTVLFPRLSELSKDETKRKALTPLMCRWVLGFTFFASIITTLFAYPLIIALFGNAFTKAFVPILLLLPGIIAGSGARVLANDIAAREKPEYNMYVSLIVVITNIAFNFILIPIFGIAGASMASSIAYILNFFIKILIYNKLTNSKFKDIFILNGNDYKIAKTAISKMQLFYKKY